jgi:hypothetical protein
VKRRARSMEGLLEMRADEALITSKGRGRSVNDRKVNLPVVSATKASASVPSPGAGATSSNSQP